MSEDSDRHQWHLLILLYGIQFGAAAISVQVALMSPREEPSGSHKLAEQTLTAVCQEVIEFPVNLKLSGDLPMTRHERTPDVEQHTGRPGLVRDASPVFM